LFTIAIIAISLATSCGSESKVKTTVSQLEKCLGNTKTEADLDNLSEEQLTEIAKCMLEPLEKLEKEFDNMSDADLDKYDKEFKDAINKSEFKEVLEYFDYREVKDILKKSDNTETSSSDESGTDCDKFIKDYEDFINSYIAVIKKYKANPTDASILTEYTEMAEKAATMETDASNCTDAKYTEKLLKLNAKLTNALAGL
jgi:hypothetical protein